MKPQFKVEEVSVEEPTPETTPEPEAEPEPEPEAEPEIEETDYSFQTQDFAAGTQPEPEPEPVNQTTGQQFQFRHQPSRKFPWWLVITIVVIVVLIIGAVKLVKGKSKGAEPTPATEDLLMSPAPSAEPTAEPEGELKREELKVQVLNGSGVVGGAGKLAKVLEDAGFEEVGTGNADNYKYEGVIIRVKEGKLNVGELIEEDLKDYEDVQIEEELDEDSEWDAEVVLGKQAGDKVQGASDENKEASKSAQAD